MSSWTCDKLLALAKEKASLLHRGKKPIEYLKGNIIKLEGNDQIYRTNPFPQTRRAQMKRIQLAVKRSQATPQEFAAIFSKIFKFQIGEISKPPSISEWAYVKDLGNLSWSQLDTLRPFCQIPSANQIRDELARIQDIGINVSSYDDPQAQGGLVA